MLVVFGAAILGVLVEAFVPSRSRRGAHVAVSLGAIAAALYFVVDLARPRTEQLTANGAVVVDGPVLFLQGTILLLAIAGVLLLSERSLDMGGSPFVAEAATIPGSRSDRELQESETSQTEVYPLLLFAVGG